MWVYQGVEQLIVPRSMRPAMRGKMIFLGGTLEMWSSRRFLADVACAKKMAAIISKGCSRYTRFLFYNYYYVCFLPTCRQGACADKLQSKGNHKSYPLLDSPGPSKAQSNRGHGAQYLYRPPPAGARFLFISMI
jgi:hypothetical protein